MIYQDYQGAFGTSANGFKVSVKFMRDPGFRSVCLYRMARWLLQSHCKPLGRLLEIIMVHSCHCYISMTADIDAGFVVRHTGDIIVGDHVKIGKHCEIRHGVTLGGDFHFSKKRGEQTQPYVGNNVEIGTGAKILGPVTIGDNVFIAANAVVVKDIPSHAVAAGVPACVVRQHGELIPVENRDNSTSKRIRDLMDRISLLESQLEQIRDIVDSSGASAP